MYKDILAISRVAAATVKAANLVGFDDKPTGAGGRVLGVAAYDAEVGDDLAVHALGIHPVVAGVAITKGQRLMSNANAQAVPVEGDLSVAFGEALADANPGQKFPALLR